MARGWAGRSWPRRWTAQDRLRLWVFQRNEPAIAFYRARGFRETLRTDGSANEEREPDALFEWTRAG